MTKKVDKKVAKVSLTKSDLIDTIAEDNKITKVEAKKWLNAVLESTVNAVGELKNEGDSLKIVEFLSIELKHSKEREGRNPRTKEVITIPAKDRFVAKLGKRFNDKLNK